MKSLDNLTTPFSTDDGIPWKLPKGLPGSFDAGLGHNFGASVVKRTYDRCCCSQDIDDDNGLPSERFGGDQAWQQGDIQYGSIHVIQAKTVIFSAG